MKHKLGIQARIFVTFSLFIIVMINLFSYVLYTFMSEKFLDTTIKNIQSEYQTITNFIDIQKNHVFSLPDYEIKNMNSLGFFFFIGNNDTHIQENYTLGLHYYDQNKNLIYRGDYKGYNIVIGKNIDDLNKMKQTFFDSVLFLNIFLIVLIFILTYFLVREVLKPLFYISNYIKNYDLDKPQPFLVNEYGDAEIGKYIDATNEFLQKIQNIFHAQKDFIQDVSHELKTPLMQINSSIEMIQQKYPDEKIAKKLQHIRRGTQAMNDIVSHLSFLLRGEEKIKQKQTIFFRQYFEQKIPEYQLLAKDKNISFRLTTQADLSVQNHPYYIDRLFDNIISNAIFYNDGNNSIDIIITKNSVKIVDQGIGMSPEEVQKVCQRFYRGNRGNIYRNNGSGLGLSIVHKITDMFGWKLEIISQLGHGTECEIFFIK